MTHYLNSLRSFRYGPESIHANGSCPRLNAEHLPWFNVKKPLDLEDFQGKLVVLDFWTFCCINCIHIMPTLKRIEKRFPESIVVLGVHSPKFPGEKEIDNVRQAIDRYEIEHPIVHDADFFNLEAIRCKSLAYSNFL